MAKNNCINFEIEGFKELNSQLDQLIKETENGARNGLKQATRNIKELSVRACKVNDGQLKNAIHDNVSETDLIGVVYVDINEAPYALYVYFGTGAFAEIPNKRKLKWYVPKSKVTKDVTRYGWKLYKGIDGQEDYYIAYGQKPDHFLETGLNSSKEANLNAIAREVKLAIERCL